MGSLAGVLTSAAMDTVAMAGDAAGAVGSGIGQAAGAVGDAAVTTGEVVGDAASDAGNYAKNVANRSFVQPVQNYLDKSIIAKDAAGSVDGWKTAENASVEAIKNLIGASLGGKGGSKGGGTDLKSIGYKDAEEEEKDKWRA